MSNTTTTSQKPSALTALRPVFVLVAICMVSGALLGAVHGVTAPIAEANAQERARQTYAMLVPRAASFEEIECAVEGCTAALRACDHGGAGIGYIIVAQAKGYGGPVPIAVAFDLGGTVTGVTVMSNDETPGLGTRVAEQSYLKQYVGVSDGPLDVGRVDLISGATISSKAVLAAFNIAIEAFEEVS